ncbi:putative vacuolar protein sorting-associated protein 13B-like, incomplete match [Sciurus carolinensis]|uniref:Vacuolar protein sorting-associated protein 13B-like, incomplete match n=1 Tax=Sciurus carolinensis TaxID=30640 RepID=A0AA41SRW2_SCICA|nr:putative vacuolar protein sorting-associated protein 13B-like, incomplete match [Sciurus carolinensis]
MDTRAVVIMVRVAAETPVVMVEKKAGLLMVVEAILEVVKATVILAMKTINLQILGPGLEETLEAKVLAPVMGETNALPNHETKLSMKFPTEAITMVVARGFRYFQKIKLIRKGELEK